MRTKILMVLMCVFASVAFSKIGAQVVLKDGSYFGFAGNYEFKDEKGGLYELFVWGTEGEFEAELSYKSKATNYKVGCKVKYVDGKNYMLMISFDKVISGTFPQKAELSGETTNMFILALRGDDLVKEHLLTVIENLNIAGHENNSASDEVFKQLESKGDEGPP